jgi:hypothetical protein
VLSTLLVSSPLALSQGYLLWESGGVASFGHTVANVGDVDGDGVSDLLVGDPVGLGQARLLSGVTGAVLLSLNGLAPFDEFGTSVGAAGDLDGDGTPDLLVGARQPGGGHPTGPPGTGYARVFSGASGTALLALTGLSLGDHFGASVAGLGDVNGDGVPDLAVGTPQPGGGVFPGFVYPPGLGGAQVFSGSSGLVLFALAGSTVGERFGWSVADIGDVDADGVSEFAIGAPGPQGFTPGPPGTVTVFSGATAAPVFTLRGGPAGDQFGFAISGPGDLDADGVPDLLVGAPQTTATGPGYAKCFSGASGANLFGLAGTFPGDRFGGSVGCTGDVSGDGVVDLVVGAPQPGFGLTAQWGTGYADVFSGANGAPLFSLAGSSLGNRFGTAVTGAGDVSGDGVPDLVVGAPSASGGLFGGTARAFSFAGIPPGSSLFGAGCAGSSGVLPLVATAGGFPLAGNAGFALVASRTLGGSTAILIFGTSSQSWLGTPLPLGLGSLGLPSCSLLVSPDALLYAGTTGAGPGAGVAFVTLPIPPDPLLVATFFHFQWYVVDPGPATLPGAMSRGLTVLVL